MFRIPVGNFPRKIASKTRRNPDVVLVTGVDAIDEKKW